MRQPGTTERRFHATPTEWRVRAIRRAPMGAATAPTPTGPPAEAGRPRPAPTRRACVLIVDDDVGTRQTLGCHLRLAGYATAEAASAREALVRASTDAPEVVVLDFHLPDMDGLACLRELRRNKPGSHPPVVLFTADWDVEDHRDEAHALGAIVASKLCDLSELERVIASARAIEPIARD